ncbi:hypothetical protein AB0M38_07100 [Streptomyces sp. NPDC051742]
MGTSPRTERHRPAVLRAEGSVPLCDYAVIGDGWTAVLVARGCAAVW